MKVLFALIALVIALALVCGCTQPSQPVKATPAATPAATPVPTTVAATPVPTTPAPTPAPTAAVNKTTPTPTPTAQATTITISASNYAFNQTSFTVSQGTTVTWINYDPVPIQIAISGNQGVWVNSGNIIQGPYAAYSYILKYPGIYIFYNSYIPSMRGTIIVTAPAS
jgi:plastocyanin